MIHSRVSKIGRQQIRNEMRKKNGQQNFFALGRCNIFCHRTNVLPFTRPSMTQSPGIPRQTPETWLPWRKAVVSSDCRFLKIDPRPQPQKKLHAYFTQLPFSIANLRTAPQSSVYPPEKVWNKLWNTQFGLVTFPPWFRSLNTVSESVFKFMC